jgi:hypothetical protein
VPESGLSSSESTPSQAITAPVSPSRSDSVIERDAPLPIASAQQAPSAQMPPGAKAQPGEPQPAVAQRMAPKRPPPPAANAKANALTNNRTRARPAGRGTLSPARTNERMDPQGIPAFGSLSELARMATAPRSPGNFRATDRRPKRAVLLVGAGVTVALGVAALSFELLGASGFADRSPSASAKNAPLFGPPPRHLVAESESTPGSRADTQQPQSTAATEEPALTTQVQPAPLDPETAPPDPPPAPAFERPRPMEPPSAMSRAPTPADSE